MGGWKPVKLDAGIYENVSEIALKGQLAALENAYVNEAGAHTRFPGLSLFQTIPGGGRVFLTEWRGDLVAGTTGGMLSRLNQSGGITDVTGFPIAGGGRIVFDRTPDELVMAAGAEIVRLGSEKTDRLSAEAPPSTHVAYVDGYTLAIEPGSGRFWYSDPGLPRVWNDLSVFTADTQPDPLTAMLVTTQREIVLAGTNSVEIWSTYPSGAQPFIRRRSVADGLFAPYTLVSDKDGVWGVAGGESKPIEFMRFAGGGGKTESRPVQNLLDGIDDWTDAYAVIVNMLGQSWIVLQMPKATNLYGTEGVSLLYDRVTRRWASLYGWDDQRKLPARWPGWSYASVWKRHFVGGENGKIYELKPTTFANDGMTQRMMGRTEHLRYPAGGTIDRVRIELRRGETDPNSPEPTMSLRCNKDNRGFGRAVRKGLGLYGQREFYLDFGNMGHARSFQFEYEITDACPVEITRLLVHEA